MVSKSKLIVFKISILAIILFVVGCPKHSQIRQFSSNESQKNLEQIVRAYEYLQDIMGWDDEFARSVDECKMFFPDSECEQLNSIMAATHSDSDSGLCESSNCRDFARSFMAKRLLHLSGQMQSEPYTTNPAELVDVEQRDLANVLFGRHSADTLQIDDKALEQIPTLRNQLHQVYQKVCSAIKAESALRDLRGIEITRALLDRTRLERTRVVQLTDNDYARLDRSQVAYFDFLHHDHQNQNQDQNQDNPPCSGETSSEETAWVLPLFSQQDEDNARNLVSILMPSERLRGDCLVPTDNNLYTVLGFYDYREGPVDEKACRMDRCSQDKACISTLITRLQRLGEFLDDLMKTKADPKV